MTHRGTGRDETQMLVTADRLQAITHAQCSFARRTSLLSRSAITACHTAGSTKGHEPRSVPAQAREAAPQHDVRIPPACGPGGDEGGDRTLPDVHTHRMRPGHDLRSKESSP
ncbi:hypothetical protein GCM10023335_22430 [Streptomyces siamensis]|uniref:Uncharacterized protein n=1 Tax=Streptomyces siamensis TaxID=1274986 RepID=A0ABP9IPU3_9ACTN